VQDTLEILFTTWEGGGNVAPVLTLARRLLGRGHRVRLLGDSCMRSEVEAAGVEFLPWRSAPNRLDKSLSSDPFRDWEASDGMEVLARMIDRMMCGPALAYARDVLNEHERRRADVIVTSEMLFGPMIAGEAAGVPTAALGCNIPIVPLPGVPPFGPGFAPARSEEEGHMHQAVGEALAGLLQRGLAPVNAARAALGLDPLCGLFDQFARLDAYLVATARAFDFPARELPSNLHYVGPLLDEPSWAEPASHLWPGQGRPRILVAFSTTFQDQVEPIRRVAQAVATLPVDAVITTGPSIDPAQLSPSLNIAVVASAPHDALMQEASVVVTHAGHGTVMRAVSAEVPLLCMPMGRDQNDNAARVCERGAGLRLQPAATLGEIRSALARLLNEPQFKEEAARLGKAIREETAPTRAADMVERLARSKAAFRTHVSAA
jgi:MGT family glycosyltransferase